MKIYTQPEVDAMLEELAVMAERRGIPGHTVSISTADGIASLIRSHKVDNSIKRHEFQGKQDQFCKICNELAGYSIHEL